MLSGHECRFRVDGVDIALDGDQFLLALELYCRRVYFARTGFELDPDDVVVDLGANCGVFTVLAAKRCARVVAVEAQSGFVDVLQGHLRRNECDAKVSTHHALIGAEEGLLAQESERDRATHYHDEPASIEMEELLRVEGIDTIDFLKMDIEGSEFSVLGEGCSWLSRVRRIAMEVHPEFGDPGSLAVRLRDAGFEVELADAELRSVSQFARDDRSGYLFAKRSQDPSVA
ncbi:FkbM family methyltransferase [Myxococcota bacterium]|nr:FkbM family methyltransferase [Myxococcota bacterium]